MLLNAAQNRRNRTKIAIPVCTLVRSISAPSSSISKLKLTNCQLQTTQHYLSRLESPITSFVADVYSFAPMIPKMSALAYQTTGHSAKRFCSRGTTQQFEGILTKTSRKKDSGLLDPLEIPDGRSKNITMDVVVSLNDAIPRKYNAIMVVVGRLTKRAHLVATKATTTAQGTAKRFRGSAFTDSQCRLTPSFVQARLSSHQRTDKLKSLIVSRLKVHVKAVEAIAGIAGHQASSKQGFQAINGRTN
ncbi:Gag-pol fusion protein [Phytophthora megakarya]|uniref:Gag-pol fusion protein n=1 Tax=Phytophthora megakarya TaxID=4795 RepID=A0A225X449_9STRA|nr:Gag-pol fusion protein [Phytophthora megakarya]